MRWLRITAKSPILLGGLNLALLVAAVTAGAIGRALDVPAGQGSVVWPRLEGIDGSVRDVVHILGANLRVVATMTFGACTFGMLPAAVLVWNGYSLGVGLVDLSLSAPEHLPVVMTYAPLEFLALALASAGSMSLSFRIAACLFAGEPIAVKGPLLAQTVAVAMLVAAAVIEAHAGRYIGNS